MELFRPLCRLPRFLRAFRVYLYALETFVFSLALKNKKVLQVLFDGIGGAVKGLAVARGREIECRKFIHYGLLRRNRGLSLISLLISLISLISPKVERTEGNIVERGANMCSAGDRRGRDGAFIGATESIKK